MTHRWRTALCALVVAVPFIASVKAADPGVTLIGFGLVPGDTLDQSGLAGKEICQADDELNCIDRATLGGFGSALAYTGFDNVFLAVPDRGPFDGRTDVPYLDRFHFMRLSLTGSTFAYPSQPNVQMKLLDTQFLKTFLGQNFVGDSSNIDRRFDPEGASVSRLGNFFVSDEYGPFINEFSRQGRLIRRIRVPEKFLIEHPTGDVDSAGNSLELYPDHNTSGRQANRGMEGLAITPNGRYLVGMMQNALIQDNGLTYSSATPPAPPSRRGLNNRILKIDLITGKSWEYVYVVDAINQGRGVNDLLAINDHEFLAIERDNRSQVPTPGSGNSPAAPNLKRIYKIDLKGATDVSKVASLPETGAALSAMSITPVVKTLFIDLLDSSYVVSASPLKTIKDVIAEKMEGLAWGPDLRDGRHVLYVASDNDLYPGLPTQIYAFAVSRAKVNYQAQEVAFPMYFGH
jgi:hypothetical protein